MNNDKPPAPTPTSLRDLAQRARELTAEAATRELARPGRGGFVDIIHVTGFRAGVDSMAQLLETWADDIENGDDQ